MMTLLILGISIVGLVSVWYFFARRAWYAERRSSARSMGNLEEELEMQRPWWKKKRPRHPDSSPR